MSEPSIKGTAFQSVLDDVSALVAEGRLDVAELEAETKASDRALLDQRLIPGLWYPIDSYTRMLNLLWKVEGGNATDYMIERGARAAQRILAAGAYANMIETAERWGGRQLVESILSLSKSLFNFVEVEIRGEITETSFEVSFRPEAPFPDCAHYASQGFFQPLFERLAGCPVKVESRRESGYEICYVVRHA